MKLKSNRNKKENKRPTPRRKLQQSKTEQRDRKTGDFSEISETEKQKEKKRKEKEKL